MGFVRMWSWGLSSAAHPASTTTTGGTIVLDQAMSAMLADLQAEGLLDQTLVVQGTEFGRTAPTKPLRVCWAELR
jgi:hypothetical protein